MKRKILTYPKELIPKHENDNKAYSLAEGIADARWQKFNERQLRLIELTIKRLQNLKKMLETIKAGYTSPEL